MNVVIVKYENCGVCGVKNVFLVPEDKTLKAGDLVKVNTNTRRGETLATCLCDSFKVDVTDVDTTDKEKIKNIFNAFGVDEPTAYVIGKFTYDEWKRT